MPKAKEIPQMWDFLSLRLLVYCPHHGWWQVSGARQARDRPSLSCRAGLEDVSGRGRQAASEGDPHGRFVLRHRRPCDAALHKRSTRRCPSAGYRPIPRARVPEGRPDTVHTLGEGQLARSPRYQELLEPLELGDELRAALMVGPKCWGFMCLHRERSSPNFTPAEAALLARLAPHLAEGLRAALLLGDSRATTPQPDGPGLVLLADDLSLVAITPAAEGWLAEVEQ